jgi:hypothetical protein
MAALQAARGEGGLDKKACNSLFFIMLVITSCLVISQLLGHSCKLFAQYM